MLNIQTFDNRVGGNVPYKALTHPLAAEAIAQLYGRLQGPIALYDPEGIAAALLALYPNGQIAARYVHDVTAIGDSARALTDLPDSNARTVLIAAFDAERIADRIAHLLPRGADVATLDAAKLPEALLTNRARYLDKLNFATNFVFFRDDDRLSTRLVSANYWSRYGGGAIRLWLRLFDANGTALATWEQEIPAGPRRLFHRQPEVRERFNLPPFTGQLFVHAIGAAGHDVVKYALDTYRDRDDGASLSCTHDANAWPSDRYAGLPAPRAGRTRGAVAAEQPRDADTGRCGRAGSHGCRAAGVVDAGSRPVRDRRDRCGASCCLACTGRRRSNCAPAAMWCGPATR